MFGYKILVVTLQRFWSINIVLLLNQKNMKKLVLLLAVAFSMSLVSCGGAKADAEAADSVATDSVVVEEVDSCCGDSAACCDSAAVDSVAA